MATADRPTGTIVNRDARGFAFVRPDSGGPDLFAHASKFVRDHWRLAEDGAFVSFVEGPGRDGKKAAFDISLA
jgi:cold shock CspA family protein